MATLRVANMYALVCGDGEDGQRALAAEDQSVWIFAKGSLARPGANAVGAPSGGCACSTPPAPRSKCTTIGAAGP